MRKNIGAANWKMHLTYEEAGLYLSRFLAGASGVTDVELILVPSFTSIPAPAKLLAECFALVRLGSQNLDWASGDAFTGEVSAALLRALQVQRTNRFTITKLTLTDERSPLC